MSRHDLDNFDMKPATLEREWVVAIQVPTGGLDSLLLALGSRLDLVQGAYDSCLYVVGGGQQRFRACEGAHAGAEGTVQSTPSFEVILSIPADVEKLNEVFEVVFQFHVQEDPTIRVHEVWGSRSKYLDDKDNSNRYWNRADAAEIHGIAVE